MWHLNNLGEIYSQNQRTAHRGSNADIFYKQNLAKKRTQDTKMLDDSCELLLPCPPSLPLPTPRYKGTPEVGVGRDREGDAEVRGQWGLA